MKRIVILALIILMGSCKQDDDNTDCSLAIPEPPAQLFINLLDQNGENLLENGTFLASEIFIRSGSTIFTDVVSTENPTLANLIGLNIFAEAGDNAFEIVLSDSQTDILILNLDIETVEGTCPFTRTLLNRATYNGIVEPIEDFNGEFLIDVVRYPTNTSF